MIFVFHYKNKNKESFWKLLKEENKLLNKISKKVKTG